MSGDVLNVYEATVIIASREDYWVSRSIYSKVKSLFPNTVFVGKKENLESTLENKKPDYIFFVFWSWKVPSHVISKNNCISFHTGDLPRDKGGSPLQNQILEGRTTTKLTMFKTSEEMDSGDIYLKKDLSLEGDLIDIFKRMDSIAPEMIEEIIVKKPRPIPQQGKSTQYKRRTPEQSEIDVHMSAKSIFNLVRSLNMDPYPPAFIKCGDGKKLYILKARLEE